MNTSHLTIRDLSKSFGATTAVDDVSLDVARGSTLAVVGPSGCGKTTLLRIIAGLDVPDRGTVSLGGTTLVSDTAFLRPERRNIGMVFQGGALFPHMTVAQNVSYGLAKAPHASDRVRHSLDLVDLGGFDNRLPGELSGGEAQRVALARALAPQPQVLLLDEPFASLDAEMRIRLRAEVAELLRSLETTAVFVTHDQEEAFVVGDEVAVMRGGRVVQVGSVSAVYQRPASAWVARFVGDANVIDAVGRGATAETVIGSLPLAERVEGACHIVVRPEHIDLDRGGAALVESVEFYGHDTAYHLVLDDVEITARAMAAPTFDVGDKVTVRYHGPPTVAFAVESVPAGT